MTRHGVERGRFMTFEGGEGGGKSTQAKALVDRLTAAGVSCIATREPGGSEVAERIREALLGGRFEALGVTTEALLFAAARIDHLDTKINPALATGTWVVCDRFHDSTRAYQGTLGQLDPALLDSLERITLAGLRPDLTFILDLPASVGLARAARRRRPEEIPDRFEKQAVVFHEKLRQAFREIAAGEPERCVVVDASQTPDIVGRMIWDVACSRFDLRTTHNMIGIDTV